MWEAHSGALTWVFPQAEGACPGCGGQGVGPGSGCVFVPLCYDGGCCGACLYLCVLTCVSIACSAV